MHDEFALYKNSSKTINKMGLCDPIGRSSCARWLGSKPGSHDLKSGVHGMGEGVMICRYCTPRPWRPVVTPIYGPTTSTSTSSML
eukprot:4090134-Pleurochrysis_carterae.AAC.1